jgi:hypothetical protein
MERYGVTQPTQPMQQPNQRNQRRNRNGPNRAGLYSQKVAATLHADGANTSITYYPFEDELGDGLNSVRISIRPRRSYFDLTGHTVEELDMLKRLFDEAFRLARPVCEELDRRAKADYEENGSNWARLWRPVPHMVDFRANPENDLTSGE